MAQDQAKLLSVRKQAGLKRTLISFHLTAIPQFEFESKGQKVDVTLYNTRAEESLAPLPSSGDIVDSLIARKEDALIFSFLLRRPPKRVESVTLGETQMQLELSWPEMEPRSRPGMTLDPGGMFQAEEGGVVAGRFLTSPYSGDWARFLVEYDPQVDVNVPMRFSVMPYPLALTEAEASQLPDDVWHPASQSQWPEALQALESKRPKVQEKFAGLRAELLLRSGSIAEAKRKVDSIFPAGNEEAVSDRLHLLRVAVFLAQQQPYLAYCHLFSKPPARIVDKRVKHYWRLAQVETALDTGRPGQALQLAQKYAQEITPMPRKEDKRGSPTQKDWAGFFEAAEGIPAPILTRQGQIYIPWDAEKGIGDLEGPEREEERIKEKIYLRRIQALLDSGEMEGAWNLVRKLPISLVRMLKTPQAMSQIADLYYQRGRYNQARPFYSQLAAILDPDEGKSTCLWRAGLCLQRSGYRDLARRMLQSVVDEYAQTPGGYRARMSLTDLDIQRSLPQVRMEAVVNYDLIAREAPQRLIREEARLKQVVALYLLGELEEAVDNLSRFLIHFVAGPLHYQAQALLVEMVPKLVPALLARDQEVEGLAMVARHRDLLVKSDLPQEFLLAMGDTFADLGLVSRSSRVFLYMLSRAESTNQRGRLYQRLIRLWSRHGLSSEVLQYAEMYVANFPRGKHGPEILALGAETLLENEKPEQALEYLLDSSRPLSRDLDVLTAKALYQVGEYQQMERYLERARIPQSPLPPQIRFAWGQAKANLGQSEQALALFRALGGQNSRYRYPALYQAAELLTDLGRPQEAIKTYKQLAEKGEGTLWAELGREGRFLAEYAQMLPDKD